MKKSLVLFAGGLCVSACMGSASTSASDGSGAPSSQPETAPPAHGQADPSAQEAAAPAPVDPWERQVFFGEQHLHTQNSPDAFAMGTRNTVDDAFDFAKGKPVKKIITGETVQKATPYDWCAVTDHAEYLSVMPLLLQEDSPLADTEMGKLIAAGKGEDAFHLIISSAAANDPIPYMSDPKLMRKLWKEHVETANKH